MDQLLNTIVEPEDGDENDSEAPKPTPGKAFGAQKILKITPNGRCGHLPDKGERFMRR